MTVLHNACAAAWITGAQVHRRPAWLALVVAIERGIEDGSLCAGDTLPSQRELAGRLGLHVNTVNRALRETARRGLTHGNTRRGTVIRPQRETTDHAECSHP